MVKRLFSFSKDKIGTLKYDVGIKAIHSNSQSLGASITNVVM